MRIGSWVETNDGDAGYIIDYQYSDPVVFFPSSGNFRRVAKDNCFDKTMNVIGIHGSFKPPSSKSKKADTFKMPLSYGVLIGFQPLTSGFYQFRQKLAGKKYPWDNGSIWKVSDAPDGNKYLVKEEETGNSTKFPHQLDTDGTPSKSPSSENGIFDGGPVPGKTFGAFHLGDIRKLAGFDFEEDWMGNVTLYKTGRVIAFLQEVEAERLCSRLASIRGRWETEGSQSPFNSYEEHLSSYLEENFCLSV